MVRFPDVKIFHERGASARLARRRRTAYRRCIDSTKAPAMNARRRSMLISALTTFAGAGTLPAWAQTFPFQPVKFLLGSAAGSVPDVLTRQIAERLAPLLGQPVIVENRPSAGGIVALEAVRASTPDGHTLSLVHTGNMSVAPSLFERLPYDTVKDFAHVGILFRGVQVLVAHPTVKASSLADLVALAKAQPGALRYSSPGNGTPTHLSMEQFNAVAGTRIEHIPYKGTAAHFAVLSGEVGLMLEGLEPLLPHIRDGRLKALAVGGPQRLAMLPDVPTFDEQGVKGIGTTWLGVVAAARTPAPVVARLNRDLTAVMRMPEIRDRFEAVGRLITPGTPEEMTALIRDEIPLWRDIVKRAHITVQ
jgi:tripartite-type tricarboxylate transporter receptor subunit TctC